MWSRTVPETQIPPGSECFQARRNIDAVAEDVAEFDADTKADASLVRYLGLAINHPALHLGGLAHRADDAGEFRGRPSPVFLTM